MFVYCPKADEAALEIADAELTALSMKIITKPQKIKIKNIVKDSLKSFFCVFKLILERNKSQNVYIAVILAGGIGDFIRQKDAVAKFSNVFQYPVIDIYNKGSKPLLSDIKSIRFFFNRDAIRLTRKKYDIVVDFSYKVMAGIANTKINNIRNDDLKKFADNFEEIKKEYPYCFESASQYMFQKKAVENDLKINDVMKLTAGIKDIKKNNIPLNYKEQNITKFGLNKYNKYITFQHGWGHGWGNKGYIPGGTGFQLKSWETANWKKLLELIKKELTTFKIVQVGINSDHFRETDIDLVGKTSFNELCTILKYSSLHIDTDGCCVHIAKAFNVQSVVLFGPSNCKFVSYDTNINIMSGLCKDCYTIAEFKGQECTRGFENPLCMNSISPDFVAKIICQQLVK